MLYDFLLVINLLSIIVVVGCIHLENDVGNEEDNGYNVDYCIEILFIEVVIKRIKEKRQRYHDTVPDGKDQDETIPIYLEQTIFWNCWTPLHEARLHNVVSVLVVHN